MKAEERGGAAKKQEPHTTMWGTKKSRKVQKDVEFHKLGLIESL